MSGTASFEINHNYLSSEVFLNSFRKGTIIYHKLFFWVLNQLFCNIQQTNKKNMQVQSCAHRYNVDCFLKLWSKRSLGP